MSDHHADRTRRIDAIAWAWLALSVCWAVVIFVTDVMAWPLALWIATTVGPLTWLRNRASAESRNGTG